LNESRKNLIHALTIKAVALNKTLLYFVMDSYENNCIANKNLRLHLDRPVR
jgi:hypothetical protein